MSTKANKFGRLAEEAAISHLSRQGYEILEARWRVERCEVDIIARNHNTMRFIEVKASATQNPISYVTQKKAQKYELAYISYLEKKPEYSSLNISFDVMCVYAKMKGGTLNQKTKQSTDNFKVEKITHYENIMEV